MSAHPTGPGTSKSKDVADPHPSTEEHYQKQSEPGGANPPKKDIGPNPGAHDGHPRPRPVNVENGE